MGFEKTSVYKYQSLLTQERDTNLAADCLLVFFAACFPALARFDAETGPASGPRDLTGGAGSFQLILEQLHQQVKL